MEPKTTSSRDVTPIQIAAGSYRKTLGWGERTLLSEVMIERDGVVPTHAHPHEQTGYVVRGAIQFTIGAQVVVLRSGDAYVIPGGTPHSCLGLEDSLAIDIFSPVREEYK